MSDSSKYRQPEDIKKLNTETGVSIVKRELEQQWSWKSIRFLCGYIWSKDNKSTRFEINSNHNLREVVQVQILVCDMTFSL